MNGTGMIVILTAFPDKNSAKTMAKSPIQKNLAACVNIIKIESSIFKWKGELKEEGENLLIIKTKSTNYKKLEKAILASHPYKVPEIIAIPVSGGYGPYLDWVAGLDRTRGSGRTTGPRSKRS